MFWRILIYFVFVNALSGCAIFKSYSNDRLAVPNFDVSDMPIYSVVILEQQADTSLTVDQIENLVSALKSESLILNVYYNETPSKNILYEDLSQGAVPVLFSIEYTYEGIESATACVEMNFLFLGLMPVSCSWRDNYTISASIYDENTELMDEYYSVSRRVDYTAWPNLYGVFLYPFSLKRNGLENSLKKDVMIALEADQI